ncbi:hypothetical protein [Lentzea albida]|uniref:Uncharacterized protein n=1 Tax=Lentzea albida TaxID=65499 RepID=A0A1H9EPT7_9PSEU|nr:hypothetical protein [Lentzea albida]SEQ27730.1 hypothetical protein SAMN04488000_102384 [Lentzea albida]
MISDRDDLLADVVSSSAATTTHAGPQPDGATWVRAAIGAINRRDHANAIVAVRMVLRDEASRMAALDVLTSVLVHGLPMGGLKSDARVPIGMTVLKEEHHCAKAVEYAASLLTAVANSDVGLAGPALEALAGDHGFDILIVLVREAAARLEYFVGVDGDTADAYYLVTGGGQL